MKLSTYISATLFLLSGTAFAQRGAAGPANNAVGRQDRTAYQAQDALNPAPTRPKGGSAQRGAFGSARRRPRRRGRVSRYRRAVPPGKKHAPKKGPSPKGKEAPKAAGSSSGGAHGTCIYGGATGYCLIAGGQVTCAADAKCLTPGQTCGTHTIPGFANCQL